MQIIFVGYYFREHNLFSMSKDCYSILKGGIFEISFKNEPFVSQTKSVIYSITLF